ncbi:ABC transporter ATP-binding protein, partial [Desulfosarcina sp.]|uniref:ABC transporter ATP-binding protein n=1 Tax=Desulfosarcina sp. TaxID=2027861 RepID=UPI0035675695
ISKTYHQGRSNAVTALQPVSLNLADGGITVFQGPSGSGKTTLLSIIGLMCRPSTGRIYIDGRETTSLTEHFAARLRRRTFGFVFQNHNLIKGRTVLDNIMIPAYPEGEPFSRLRQRALSLLERLKLADKAGRQVTALSGGELQRVAVARAMINSPSVLIADEPTAHLDSRLADRFLEIAADLSAEGLTVLAASHDPRVCNAGCVDRLIFMQDGRVVDSPQVPA